MQYLYYIGIAMIVAVGAYILVRICSYGAIKSYYQAKREERKKEANHADT